VLTPLLRPKVFRFGGRTRAVGGNSGVQVDKSINLVLLHGDRLLKIQTR
jgi:hypothetical protein